VAMATLRPLRRPDAVMLYMLPCRTGLGNLYNAWRTSRRSSSSSASSPRSSERSGTVAEADSKDRGAVLTVRLRAHRSGPAARGARNRAPACRRPASGPRRLVPRHLRPDRRVVPRTGERGCRLAAAKLDASSTPSSPRTPAARRRRPAARTAAARPSRRWPTSSRSQCLRAFWTIASAWPPSSHAPGQPQNAPPWRPTPTSSSPSGAGCSTRLHPRTDPCSQPPASSPRQRRHQNVDGRPPRLAVRRARPVPSPASSRRVPSPRLDDDLRAARRARLAGAASAQVVAVVGCSGTPYTGWSATRHAYVVESPSRPASRWSMRCAAETAPVTSPRREARWAGARGAGAASPCHRRAGHVLLGDGAFFFGVSAVIGGNQRAAISSSSSTTAGSALPAGSRPPRRGASSKARYVGSDFGRRPSVCRVGGGFGVAAADVVDGDELRSGSNTPGEGPRLLRIAI